MSKAQRDKRNAARSTRYPNCGLVFDIMKSSRAPDSIHGMLSEMSGRRSVACPRCNAGYGT